MILQDREQRTIQRWSSKYGEMLRHPFKQLNITMMLG
jgi:hypothetical protein